MPTFENGWICRECWSANREQDQRCYRCHAVPKRYEKPEPITFSTPDGKPNEDRKKVSSLIAARVEPAAEATPPPPPTPSAPSIPLSERIRGMVLVVRLRAAIAAVVGAFGRIVAFGRAVVGAPGAGARLVSRGVRGARDEASARTRSALAHRRLWLGVAWLISAFSSALLFSVALHAPLAASLLVIASVAIFSGLTAAIVTNTSERQSRAAGVRAGAVDGPVASAAEHAAQPAEILGSRAAH
jgi:hypothetical protein